jgi:hypothetical protein
MAYGEVDVQIKVFLTSALVEGVCSASPPGRFSPGERAPGTNRIREWGEPQNRYGRRDSNCDPSAAQPVASRYVSDLTVYVETYGLK